MGDHILIKPSKLLPSPGLYPVRKVEPIANGKGVRISTPSLTSADRFIESDFPLDCPVDVAV